MPTKLCCGDLKILLPADIEHETKDKCVEVACIYDSCFVLDIAARHGWFCLVEHSAKAYRGKGIGL